MVVIHQNISVANESNEKIFFSGLEYFNNLLADIDQAKSSIDLETYIFVLDQAGNRVVSSLIKAAERGVVARVLVDGAGTPQWGGEDIRRLEQAGVETRIFHPFPWRLWQWSRSRVQTPSLLKAIYLLLKINSRNHRKVCVIDKKIAYIGSFNILQNNWRDTGVRLCDVDLKNIFDAFESAWHHLPIQERVRNFFRHIKTNPIIRLNNTWYRRRILHKNLLEKIKECHNRIWITNAYFVPDNFLLRRLIDAAKRKIDVRILLPRESDVSFMPWASEAFYARLLRSGVRIFEYQPTVLHAKTFIIDDWMIVGSSNLNHRSLLHDLEVDVDIRSEKSKRDLKQQFLLDLGQSKEVLLPDWEKRSWHQRLVGRVLLYLKYLI